MRSHRIRPAVVLFSLRSTGARSRYLYAGKPVLAWGGPFRGTETILGEQFQSTFQRHRSRNTCRATARSARQVPRSFAVSRRAIARRVGDVCGRITGIEPGLVPAADVVLVWRTFPTRPIRPASHVDGGIHFESGDLEARALGRRVGRRVWEKARALFLGHDRHVLHPSQGHDASESADRDSHR